MAFRAYGVRLGLGFGVLAIIGCSGADPNDAAISEDGVTQADPTAPGTPPPPPASPLPGDLKLDTGAADAAPPPPAPPADPGFRTMWAVDESSALARFTSTEPGKVTSLTVTGLAAGERVLGVDFRPKDGQLYALGSTSRLYVIERKTGAAKAVGTKAFTPALGGTAFGFDVNPVADKIRVHSDTDQNLRLDPVMGTGLVDGVLAFADGDVNKGQSPNLVATAYTNSVSPAPSATVLYAIDSTRNLLTRLAAPNDGKVTTVGGLGVDTTEVAGFDIWGAAGALQAYATLTVKGVTGLYTIDLDKGTATLVGPVGSKSALRGLAIEP